MKSKRKMVKSLVFVGLVLVFALSLINQVEARKIRGEYAIVGEQACVVHWLVNPNNPTNPTASTYWTQTESMQGTYIFNGDGTGSAEISSVEIIHPTYTPIPLGAYWGFPLPLGVLVNSSTNKITFHFTYTVSRDGAITRSQTPGTITGTITSGTLAGKTFTFTPITLTGFVSRNDETILLSSSPEQPNIITIDFFNSDGSLFGREEQECQRSRVLTKIRE
jgi:hypothetical protein